MNYGPTLRDRLTQTITDIFFWGGGAVERVLGGTPHNLHLGYRYP